MKVLFWGATNSATLDASLPIEKRFAAVGRNTGNLLIGQSLFEELAFTRQSWANVPPEAADEQFDVIVIAASNFLFRGFDFSYMADFIEKTRLPTVLIGVGAQSPKRKFDTTTVPDGTKRLLSLVAERSHSIGARGYITAEALRDLGIRNVSVIGCPSLFRTRSRKLRVKRHDGDRPLRVVVNGSSDITGHSASPEHANRLNARLIAMARANSWDYVLQSEINEMKLASGVRLEQAEAGAIKAMLKKLGEPLSWDDFASYLGAHGRAFFNIGAWGEYLRSFDLSLGPRFHGNLLALTNGVPAVVVAHDSRTTELAELMGIPHVLVDSEFPLDPVRLLAASDLDAFEERYSLLYDRFATFLALNGLQHHLLDARDANIDEQLEPAGEIVF